MLLKNFILYEQALELKKLKFNKPCLANFINGDNLEIWNDEDFDKVNSKILAPTFSQAFKWFRDKHGLKHDIDDDNVGTKFYYRIKSYTDKFDNYDDILKPMREEKDWNKIEFKTYEKAELECLKKLIKIVKAK